MSDSAYRLAQHALADLKVAVRMTLEFGPNEGMTNAQLGRTLGIYAGHEGHEGHIPRVLLALLEEEGVVQQNPATRRWSVRQHTAPADVE